MSSKMVVHYSHGQPHLQRQLCSFGWASLLLFLFLRQNCKATVKGFLVMMVPFISQSSLKGSWERSMKIGWKGRWLETFVSLDFSILLQATKFGWLLAWDQFIGKRRITGSPTWERWLTDYLDMPQRLLFCTLWFSCFSFEFNKGLEHSKFPMKTIYYLLI